MAKIVVAIKQEEIPFSENTVFVQKNPTSKRLLIEENLHSSLQKYFENTFDCNVSVGLESSKEITIKIANIPEKISFPEQKTIGPKLDAPTQAVEGFYRKWKNACGKIVQDEKTYVFIKEAQTKTAEELAPEIAEQTLIAISKLWRETLDIHPLPWTRPINSISAFLNGKPIAHKFSINTEDSFYVSDIGCYFESSQRQIDEEISKITAKHGYNCLSWGCVPELAWLYENPQFAEAEIPQEYLSLPKEVLNLTIAKNQRYILFEKDDKIVPLFLIVGKRHNEIITKGHIKTLRARLDDAQYYIKKDLEIFDKEGTADSLKKIIFHEKYGSIYERVDGMQKWVSDCKDKIKCDADLLLFAIKICKNDLTTHMVQSFTDLQGYIGGEYLIKLHAKKEIAEAVAEHYKPLNPKDSLPQSKLGMYLSFVDKLEKVNALAKVGEIPTSSRDPFAIRRDILSIIRLIEVISPESLQDILDLFNEKLHGFVKERMKLFQAEYAGRASL